MPVRQPSLLDGGPVGIDTGLDGIRRRFLGAGAWLDRLDGWVAGAETLFDDLAATAPWREESRPMYDRIVDVPRLVTGVWPDPPAVVGAMADALAAHYGEDLRSVSANLYRSGADSVAWHGDRIARHQERSTVAIVSLGAPRRFLIRPTGGGPSIRLEPGPGDLLVMGGTAQRTFEHCVPKRARAGPRISVMFRTGPG